MFEERIPGLEDPLQKLRFLLSFYRSQQETLASDFQRMERACFRKNNHECVSEHDAYALKQAELERKLYRAEQELAGACRQERDWAKSVLEPQDRAMTLSLWLSLHPQCARPYVEKYVGLMKEEVDVMTEAQNTLGKYLAN